MAGLCLYFSFFVGWWRLHPENLHLLANVFVLGIAAIALLAFLSVALAELAKCLGEQSMVSDFRVALWMSLFLGIIPLLWGLASLVVVVSPEKLEMSRRLASMGERLAFFLQAEHTWMGIGLASACLFPVAVLMAGMWKLKARALRMLAGG